MTLTDKEKIEKALEMIDRVSNWHALTSDKICCSALKDLKKFLKS